MRRIANAVRGAGERLAPVLLMDCARQHIQQSVFEAAARLGVRLVWIPAELRWLLQPCDAHVFSGTSGTFVLSARRRGREHATAGLQ